MKLAIPALLLTVVTFCANAQQPLPTNSVVRNVRFRILGKDSVNLDLNENYMMIEDSCSVIIRQGHFNNAQRKFTGKFKDVNKANPSVVVSSGTYDDNGLKNGEFVVYNLDGSLQAKGSYRNDKFDGGWEINYADGKPAVVFSANNDTVTIESVWDKTGKKIVDKGKGTYAVNQGGLTWKGKLENGRPNGNWELFRTDDASESTLAHELFFKNIFKKGANAVQDYKESRIVLIDGSMLTFLNAEKMLIAPPCNAAAGKHVLWAQYKNGTSNFTAYVFNSVANLVQIMASSTSSNTSWTNNSTVTITGNISEKGELSGMKSSSNIGGTYNGDLGQDIIRRLRNLPLLEPATINGKPVKQGFTVTLVFKNGSFTVSYRFLPI